LLNLLAEEATAVGTPVEASIEKDINK